LLFPSTPKFTTIVKEFYLKKIFLSIITGNSSLIDLVKFGQYPNEVMPCGIVMLLFISSDVMFDRYAKGVTSLT